MNLKCMTMADSRGKESKTLFFVFITWFVLVVKFIASGMTIGGITVAPMDVMDFGVAVTGVLMIWVGREHVEKSVVAKGMADD